MHNKDIVKHIEDINFTKMGMLKLEGDVLTSIEGLCRIQMPILCELYLRNNNITKIRMLRKTKLPIYWLSTSTFSHS